jgi:hypothetical protein
MEMRKSLAEAGRSIREGHSTLKKQLLEIRREPYILTTLVRELRMGKKRRKRMWR